MATETQKPQIETLNSPIPLDLNNDSSPKPDELKPNPNSTGDGNPNPSKTPAVVVAAAAAAEDEVIQKKIKRAERFGVPVQMSEEEKRNSRSHRFGCGTGPEVSKSAEDQKRKARAERFGIPVPADEEVKKKSRVERFGSNKKVDDVEEEKRKARALRFSHPQVTAVLHTNGNKDSASKATTVDNSSGAA